MKIENAVTGLEFHKYDELVPIQGNLKSLTDKNYEKLKHKLISLKFSEPIGIWKSDGCLYILSGTQRWRTVKTMVEKEGYEPPDLPCFVVEAADRTEAKNKILSLCCQYGEINELELYEFMQDIEWDAKEFTTLNIPKLDTDSFIEGLKSMEKPKRRRYQRICPKCGHIF